MHALRSATRWRSAITLRSTSWVTSSAMGRFNTASYAASRCRSLSSRASNAASPQLRRVFGVLAHHLARASELLLRMQSPQGELVGLDDIELVLQPPT